MKALITGASGFVGNHLARLLVREGADVWGTAVNQSEKMKEDVADEVTLVICDIREKDQLRNLLKTCRPDYIFHLAAQSNVARSWENPAETFEINVIGTINLLDEIVKLGTAPKTLLVGSAEEYGKLPPEQMPIVESTSLNPVSPYGVSKASSSMLFKQYYTRHDLPVLMARSFNHIGPEQSPGFVTADFAKQIAEIEIGARKPVITVGNLDASRDFTSVTDVCKAYLALIKKGLPGEVYNVGSGRYISIQKILEFFLNRSSVKIEVVQDSAKMRPSDVPIMFGDITKIKNHTGWEPTDPMEKCLEEVLEYWRGYISSDVESQRK